MHIGLGGGVQPHFGVHGGGKHHGAGGHENRRGEQIIGPAGGNPGHEVGGGWRHHNEIGLLPNRHMLHLIYRIEDGGGYGIAAQGFEGGLSHKPQGRFGGHHGNIVTCFFERPHYMAGLICGNASGDTNNYFLLILHQISLSIPTYFTGRASTS